MIYYLNYSGIYSSVFDSQILTPILKLKENGFEINLINFEKKTDIIKKDYNSRIDTLEKELNIKTFMIINNPFLDKLTIIHYINSIIRIIKNNDQEKNIIFFCRTQIAGAIALKVKEKLNNYCIKVVTDFRGDIIEEYKLVYKNRCFLQKLMLPFLIFRINKFNIYVVSKSDYIFCVSNKLKELLMTNYCAKSNKIMVIPTCLDVDKFKFNQQKRIELREKLEINNRFVVIYSGGGQTWQMPDTIIETFSNIKKEITNAILIILTKDQDTFNKYLDNYEIDKNDFILKTCNHNEIIEYLSIGDIALLLREANGVNKVACPTKFAEYLSCYLPIITSKGIGDLDVILEKYNIGFYNYKNMQYSKQIINLNKEHTIYDDILLKYFSWDNKLKDIVTIFKNI